MPRDPLRRKLTVRARGRTLILVKRREESGEHVVEMAPAFWREGALVGTAKPRDLLRRFPATHFAVSKWGTLLPTVVAQIDEALDGLRRSAPVELVGFPDAAAEWLDADGDGGVPRDALFTHAWPAWSGPERHAARSARS